MKSLHKTPFAVVAGLAFLAACNGSTSVPPHVGGSTPTPTPVPGQSSTPTPIPTTTPTPGSAAIACNGATATLPGTYFSIFTEGLTTGSTYAQDTASGTGEWSVDTYAAATPAPTPTPTTTPVPTTTPTIAPTATPTPLMYSIFYGTETVQSFTIASPATTVPSQTGCFVFVVAQPVGGTIAQFRGDGQRAAAATPNPNDNGVGEGFPTFSSDDFSVTNVGSGNVTAFALTNLSESRQTGSGTFTLDNGATGTVTIQGAANQTMALPARVRGILSRQQATRSRVFHR